jgi:nucleotide-binding universal stress UspA family protein
MNQPSRLLVTYDGSAASRSIFPPALKLAQRLQADIVLLRVHHAPSQVWVHPDAEYREARLAELQQEWDAEIQAVATELSQQGIAVTPLARVLGQRWSIADEILAVADEYDVDFVCMATHGESTLRRFFIGSTALSVLSRCERPVIFLNVSPQ